VKNLVGNHFLIVDTDLAFACELALAIKTAGGESSIVSTSYQAVSCLKSFGADVVLCGKLSVSELQELLFWREGNKELAPKFIQLHTSYTQQPLFLSLCYRDCKEIVEQLPQLLFGVEDFFKSLLEFTDPSTITYQLKLNTGLVVLEPLELSYEGIYFSADGNFAFDKVKSLKVSFHDFHSRRSFNLPGVLEYHSKGGPFFRVHPDFQFQWDMVLHHFKNKQENISGFLKKAAGF
jgi:hypothetical protein